MRMLLTVPLISRSANSASTTSAAASLAELPRVPVSTILPKWSTAITKAPVWRLSSPSRFMMRWPSAASLASLKLPTALRVSMTIRASGRSNWSRMLRAACCVVASSRLKSPLSCRFRQSSIHAKGKFSRSTVPLASAAGRSFSSTTPFSRIGIS